MHKPFKHDDSFKLNLADLDKRNRMLLFCGLCLVFLFISISSLFFPHRESLTYDEPIHYMSGEAVLSGKPSELGANTINFRNVMPTSALGPLFGIPMATVLPDRLKSGVPEPELKVYLAKFPTLLVSLLLAAFVYRWAKQLYGINAGFLAMTLYVLDPNIIAHSRMVTQDVFGAFSVFVATYFFWNFLKSGGKKFAVLSILMFGIAQVSRYTSVYLVPIFLILAIGFHGRGIVQQFREKNFTTLRSGAGRFLRYSMALALVTALIINLGFSFERTGTRLGDYQFESKAFQSLQSWSVMLQSVPVPLPYSYLSGLDMGAYKRETGFGSGPTYLLGKLGVENRQLKGFKEYFIVAFFYKVPVATQVLLVLAVFTLFRRRKRANFWQNEAFLLVPALFYFIVFSYSTAQLGIRYILMIFPFLFVFSSSIVARPRMDSGAESRVADQAANQTANQTAIRAGYGVRGRMLACGLLIYLLASNLSWYPHYLSYFNEFLTDRTMGYKILADSNLDWDQNKIYMRQYLKENPEVVWMDTRIGRLRLMDSSGEVKPEEFAGGPVAISVNELLGITQDPKAFEWIRENKQPFGHVAYSYLLFDLQAEDFRRVLQQPAAP